MNKWVKRMITLTIAFLALVGLLLLSLQTTWVKSFIKNRVETYVSAKTNTILKIEAIDYKLPKWLELRGVFLKDRQGDTLLYGGQVRVDMSMLKLLNGQVEIQRVELEGIQANIQRAATDTTFNFQFLIDSFVSSQPKQPATTDTTAIQFSLDEVNIKKSTFYFEDNYGGLIMGLSIGDFSAVIDKIDLSKKVYSVKETQLHNSNLRFKKGKNSASASSTTSVLPFLKIADLKFNQVNISYIDDENNYRSQNVIDKFSIKNLAANLNKNDIAIDVIKLQNSYVSFHKDKTVDLIPQAAKDTTSTSTIKVSINKIDLENNRLVYNDATQPQKSGVDFSHLNISDFGLTASNIYHDANLTKVLIEKGRMKEKSGFRMDSVTGNFMLNKEKIVAQGIKLHTPKTQITGNGEFYIASLNNTFKPNQINSISLYNTVVSKEDVALLFPAMREELNQQLQGANYLYITATAKGTARKFYIKQLNLYTDKKNAIIDIAGVVNNPFDKNRIEYDLTMKEAKFNQQFLSSFIPVEQKSKINLPPAITIAGNIEGNTSAFTANLIVNSTYGKINLQGTLTNITNANKLSYDATIKTENFETGKWIRRDSVLGVVNGTIYVKGQGINYKKANITSSINIASFKYLSRIYKDVAIVLTGKNGIYSFEGSSKDPELNINMRGKTYVGGEYPTLDATLLVKNADLYSLGLYDQPLSIQTNAELDIANLDPHFLKVNIRLDSTVIAKNRQRFFIDSLTVKGNKKDSITVLAIRSPLTDAAINGNFDYTDLDNVIKYLIDTYRGERPQPLKTTSIIALDVAVKPHPIYSSFVPNLYFDRPIYAKGGIKTANADSTVALKMNIPYIRYNNQAVANFNLSITGKQDSLSYALTTDTLRSNSLFFYQTIINGIYSKNTLSADLRSKDANGKNRYAIGLQALLDGNIEKISLNDNLLLNYDKWYVNKENLISITRNGKFNVADFEIKNNGQVIEAQSTSLDFNAPMYLIIKNFDLSNITSILNKDSTLINGQLSATLRADNFENPIPTLNGNIVLDSLVYNRVPVGNLSLEATAINKTVKMDGSLSGLGNKVNIAGLYTPTALDVNLDLNPIRLKSIEPFTVGYLKNSIGYLTGNIKVGGSPTNPTWSGELSFDSVYTQLAQYGTPLRINRQKLYLQSPNIIFKNFVIADSLYQPLTLNGFVMQDNKGDLVSDLLLSAKDFMALNSTAADNSQYYGKAIVDVEAEVKGIITAPEISGNVKLKEKSKITYVRQRDVPGIKDREGVMAFIDADTIANMLHVWPVSAANINKKAKAIYQSSLLKYNLNIDIDPKAEFNIIIDPATRDQLTVAGPATLNAGVNPNGSLVLTGAYTLNRGTYTLNYQFIKREFQLQEGSNIIFKGSPTDAEPDITAVYEVETRPIDLIRNEITNYGLADKIFQQRMPFLVVLKITGTLTEPKLAFDIKLKDNVAGLNSSIANAVNNKLTQIRYDASSLNKQVFALLVMNRFFGEQARDFFAGGGSSPQDVIKESVSRFLSDAVNQIAADLIKGVDLNVDLRSVDDYASAAKRTDLDLALSKRFLNDRVSITVGKNFTLEGEDPIAKSQNNRSVQFLPDITTSYKLSKDGKYMVRVYRRNQYEAILDGYFIETGLVFSFSLDYNKAQELLFWQNSKNRVEKP